MEAAISSMAATQLAPVEIVTLSDERYVIPAMDVAVLQRVLPKGTNRIPPNTPSLALVNASMAVLCIPFRIVRQILVGGEEWWSCPSPA